MVEEWRDIIIEKNGVVYNFEGKYQVSNYGRVRSLNYRQTGEIRVLKLRKRKDGYLEIGLCKIGKKQEMFKVHRLVATAFIPNPHGLPEVNHIREFDKEDNSVDNLEWCDRKYNMNYGTRIERVKEKQSKKVVCIETSKVYLSILDVERKLGLDQSNISKCCKGKYKTAGGYHWKYYTDFILEINEKNEQLIMELKVV